MAIDTSVHKSQMTICICEQLLFVNNEVNGKTNVFRKFDIFAIAPRKGVLV